MRSIRDVAVFAWAVTGINPSLANYGQGRPRIGPRPAEAFGAWEPNSSRPTTYPPPEDLAADRAADVPKDPSAAGPAFGDYSEPPLHCRTRHASLDENMYDMAAGSNISSGSGSTAGGGSRSAGWHAPASTSSYYGYEHSAYHYPHHHGSGSSHATHHGSHHTLHHRNRPPLRPAFSYDALHEHARRQQ